VLIASEKDGECCRALLTQAGIHWEECPDLGRLCHALEEGAAVALLAEEWVDSPQIACLLALLERQPTWSDLPILILARGADAMGADFDARRLGNVALLERPLRTAALLTALRTALRSRRRQYQLREHLKQREEAEGALRESEARLRFSLDAGGLGFWQHDLGTDALICSDLCKAHFGRSPGEPLSHEEVLGSVHPEDLDRVRKAIRRAILDGQGYVLEYRVIWPDGSTHWVMVRGRASYDVAGKAVDTHGVTLDITERRDAETRQEEQAERLRLLSESLRETARRKDEFLAMLAHELRNPLSPMVNAVEVMRSRAGREQGERARDVLERQVHHMSRLVDDLLDVSRINSGKITLKKERLDLVEAVKRAIETVRGFAEAPGHTLEVSLPAEPVWVDVDPVRLEQVVTNLLNNAAKYTEPGGHIWVALETDGASARMRVRDTGIGIPPSLLGQVFDLFTQGERGLDRSQGGLGLGLTLVRNLVRLHGGTVEAFSDGPGQGSEFRVTLPLAPAPEAVASLLPVTPVQMRAVPTVNGSGSRRLLVVDDNRDSAETLADLARIWGFEVDTAYDGLAALERAGEWQPALVFLDIGMPGLNGYEVARQLRQDRRFDATTLVALTGYGQEEDIERSRAAGFDHHLVKPVDLDKLEALLESADLVASLTQT
jgi:two-component system CheB/CheR fusion protein